MESLNSRYFIERNSATLQITASSDERPSFRFIRSRSLFFIKHN